MTIPLIAPETFLLYTLVFLRVGAMLIVIPILGERSVPGRLKAGLAILISFLVYPTLKVELPPLQREWGLFTMAFAMSGEIFIGILIGFTARLVFAGIQFAGDMIGLQMGFSIVNVIDPLSSANVSIFAEFQYLIALLIFLIVDAHHIFLFAMTESFRFLNPLGVYYSASLMQTLLVFSGAIFSTAVKISAPVLAVLMFTHVALGIVARTVPQINVFIVGFPIQIAAGLIVFGLTVPLFVQIVQRAIDHLAVQIHTLLQLMASVNLLTPYVIK